MTPQDRAKIVQIIAATIRDNGPQELKFLPNRLVEGGIPKTTYTPRKKTLETLFPEFVVYGTNGYETVDFAQSDLSKFYRMLVSKVPYQPPVTPVSLHTVTELAREVGLDAEKYSSADAVKELLKVYPAYQLPDANGACVACAAEIDYILAITYINWKQLASKLAQSSPAAAADGANVREKLEARFAKALLDGNGLLTEAMNEEEPRVVLATGYQTANGEDIYCILQPNQSVGRKQEWTLAGAVYPNEADANGLGAWLAKTFFPQTSINYQSLRTQLDDLSSLREELVDALPAVLEDLRAGICPAPVSEKMAQYEKQWRALNAGLEQLPSLAGGVGTSLENIMKLLDEKNALVGMSADAVKLFDQLYAGVQKQLALVKGQVPQTDYDKIHGLFNSTDMRADVQRFREILHPYVCLREVLRSSDVDEIHDCIATVAEHFSMGKMKILSYLLGAYEEFEGLELLDDIENVLSECLRSSTHEETPVVEPIDADTLAQAVLACDGDVSRQWISLYRGLLPDDEQLRAAIVPENGDGLCAADLTPAAVADRLLSLCGNQDRLAERYLLLGLITDRKACVPRLLGLYRESGDEARFLTLWQSGYRQSDFTVQDACCWLSIRCKTEPVCWDEIEEFVARYPEVKQSREYEAAIRDQLARADQHSAAYRKWISMKKPELNPLETAIANNDMDAVYQLLADSEQMLALDYTDDEITQIKSAVTSVTAGGTDVYGKALRLYSAQKNKNDSAECLLWSAAPTAPALKLLFDIYAEASDHASLCWLTQKFSMTTDTMARSAAYAEALAQTQQYHGLSELLKQHPELWHRSELLKNLEGEPWEAVYQREAACPIAETNAFVSALIEDDSADMEQALSDAETMADYSEDMIAVLRQKLAEGAAPAGTDRAAVVKRFMYYQGNLHRHLEAYLYQQFDADADWAVQQLYTLSFAQERYVDACAYYDAYPMLAKATANVSVYMWCLLHLGKTEKLFEQVQAHPESLRADAELVKAVLEIAHRNEMVEFSESIRRMLALIPQNAFEKAVMTSNVAEMLKYVSDPDLLTALGYTAENIARFKDRISKPLPAGADGYALAIRMRLFFGNDRVVPFLLDAQNDPRAARLLLDIYCSAQRWDDVCELYRTHLPNGIWNATYEQRYIDALSKSRVRENCRLYLDYLQSEQNTDKTTPAYQWKYLRSLVGVCQEEAALAQMQQILDSGTDFVFDAAMDVFDMVWEHGSDDLREQTALFAARLYLQHMDTLTLDKQKAVLSLHENLLCEEDSRRWINLFNDNGLQSIATFLMCYFKYGIGDDSADVQSAANALFALLDDDQKQCDSSILTAVTNFALDNGLLSDPASDRSEQILSCWMDTAFARDEESGQLGFEELTDTEYSAFHNFWHTASLTETQINRIFDICLRDVHERSGWTASFFQRIASILSMAHRCPAYAEQYADQLIAAFTSWFSELKEEDSASIKVAVHFLEKAELNYTQMKTFLHATADLDILYDGSVRSRIIAQCADTWPDLQYGYLQALYFRSEQEEQRQEVIGHARQLLREKNFDIPCDNDSLRFAYSIVCADPTPDNLSLLHGLYEKAEKPDQANIILKMAEVNSEDADAEALCAWFCTLLEERPTDWIEFYSKWWAPLVRLRDTDNQTKSIISYLSDDDASMRYKESVLRLLLSNPHNSTYIGCYLSLESGLSPLAAAKLLYIRAVHDGATCADAIRECIAKKQFLYAIKLLTSRIKPVAANAVFIGQTAGEIFTAEALGICPELKDFVPAVFRHIIQLNQADPAGAWKNVGRAVDIAVLTEQEHLFFDIFNQEYQNMYFTYSGKCAALIANLMLRGDFETASHYLREYSERTRNDPYQYMNLLSSIIDECISTGALSEENDILVRSIPLSGNMRSLEQYGALVHYALQKQRIKPCAKAFYTLLRYVPQDKALLACCIQLYNVLSDELSVKELYNVAKSYLDIVQDTLAVRTAKIMAVISACAAGEIDEWRLLEDCGNRIHDGMVLTELKNLQWECSRFLEGSAGRNDKKLFLLRAATGWWQIDENTAAYFGTFETLCPKLMELYPSAFYSACIAGALRYREYSPVCNAIIGLMKDYHWGTEQLQTALGYSDELCEKIISMTSAPIDLPGIYAKYLHQVLAEQDDDAFLKLMNMLLVIQRNFTIKQFEENMFFLKEMSEQQPTSRQYELSRLILKKSLLANNVLLLPRQYVDAGEYEKCIIAAEKQLEKPLGTFYDTLNNSYLQLGKFMTERSTTKKYKLQDLMNMATLLSQSKSYGDLHMLLEICPAKWKLCLRSAQEFVQGNPENVLYLLNNPAFQTHDWCYKYIFTLAKNYLDYAKWSKALQMENQRYRRLPSWGRFKLSEAVKQTTPCSAFLLRSDQRNFANLDSYKKFVDKYVAEMQREDPAKNVPAESAVKQDDDDAAEIMLPGVPVDRGDTIWKLPFVADCLAPYLSDEQDTDESNLLREERKQALQQALKTCSDAQTTEICSELLALMRQEPVTYQTKEICIQLALALYSEKRAKTGMVTHVTEEARTILYSMVPCFEGVPSLHKYTSALKVYVRECLESYQNLSQFTTDCAGDALLGLCAVVAAGDKDAADHFRKHIHFARKIGKRMREPMTNTERLKWLQKCVTSCPSDHPTVARAKETLVNMLNQEIRVFRNKAQIYMSVYNTESIVGNGCIFGKVENFGSEGVSKLVISLTIDGVFKAQYSLSALGGAEMVPFSLPCDVEKVCELPYKLSMKYVTSDGTEETATPVEGILNIREPDPIKNRFQRYDASNPADSDNYIERVSISDTLKANYLVDGGFRRFPNFAIYGMKRSGKSSVLRRIGRLFNEHFADDVRYVIVSCEGITGDFYTRAHCVFVKYVLDELDYKFDMQSMDGWEEFCKKWEELPENTADFRWLDSFYSALNRQWMPETGLVILVDEIERLYFELGDGFNAEDEDGSTPQGVDSGHAQSVLWDVINKMTQRDGSMVRFVLCGSDFFTSKIIAEGDNLTQFFQKGVKLNVDRMEYEEIKAALCANSSVVLHEDTINYLWNIAAGLPWHSKIFCNSVIENQLIRKEGGTRSVIYPSDIQDAIDLTLSTTKDIASPANFGLLSLNAEEELIVHETAKALGSRLARISLEDLMERISLADKDESKTNLYTKALRSLVNERKLLKLDKGRNYQFGCELYRLYLRHELPSRFL